jgi:hypothetical protein
MFKIYCDFKYKGWVISFGDKEKSSVDIKGNNNMERCKNEKD